MPESAEAGPPGPSSRKNRKINRSAGQLKRNAACVPCRRRRVKCDGTRPICATCTRSFQFLARTQPDAERDALGVQCWFEDAEDADHSEQAHDLPDQPTLAPTAASQGQKRKATGEVEANTGRTIYDLEMKVAELQSALSAATVEAVSRSSSVHLPSQSRGSGSSASVRSDQYPPPYASAPTPLRNTSTPDYSWPPVQQMTSLPASLSAPPPMIDQPPLLDHNTAEQAVFDRMDAEAGEISGPFLDVFWPGWPKRLPTPTMMDHLVFTFFNSLPGAPRLIHRESLQTRLALPPRHPNFPHTALLHAICAAAARYSATVKVSSIQQVIEKSLSNPPVEIAPGQSSIAEEAAQEPCFSERHCKYSMLEDRYDNCQGTKLLDLLQAQMILCQYFCQTAKWLDGWIMSGKMTRIAVALGLLDEQGIASADPTVKSGMLPPPKNDGEREERRAIACEIIATDLQYSASGSWPGTLPAFDEMASYVHLPASSWSSTGTAPISENPQTINSTDLYTHHPVEDGFVMYLKASFLLGRVSKFCRRLRRMPATQQPLARQLPVFISVDQDLIAFSRSFPMPLRDPVQSRHGYSNRLDADLVNALLIPRVASILLHLPFADVTDSACPSAARVLVESRACLGVLYRIMSTTTDMAQMLYPMTSLWLYHPARALLMFYHRALEIRDENASLSLLGEIEIFQMALAALGNRFALGAVHCGMVDIMVRRIQEEFGIPPQNWRWSPRDWSGGQQDSSALNYQAGMRSRNPRLPLLPKTHPEGAAWSAEGKDRKSYREIIDQQRSFVGTRSRSRRTADLANLAEMAGLVIVPTQPATASVPAAGPSVSATMGPLPHMYDPCSYPATSMPVSDAGWEGSMPTLASIGLPNSAVSMGTQGVQLGGSGSSQGLSGRQ